MLPPDDDPYADWSATLFLAQRAQYVLITNTRSLYSVVTFGRGITNDGEFISRAVSHFGELMEHDGYQFLRERAFLPETATILFAKALNRSVIGSMNDLVYNAQILLTENEIAPFDVSFELNEMLEFPRFRGHPVMTLWPDFSGVSKYHPPRENAATAILEHVFSALYTSCAPQLAFRSLASSNSAGER